MKLAFAFVLLPAAALAQGARSVGGALPPSGGVEQVVFLEAGKRTLYVSRGGDVWAFDHSAPTPAHIAGPRVWDVSVAPGRDLLVYVKGGEERADHFIYVLPMDPISGRPSGRERRLTATQGDAPAVSPDGRFVAFARDDSSGVGQSLVVVPVAGGRERVVAANMPSSIRSIAWTPDGKAIYFGVNPPVPCVPEWSCLRLGDSQRRWATIRRVAASGGAVSIVVTIAQSPFPGLSPDGTTIVYRATGGSRRWIVAGPDGRTRTALTFAQSQVAQGWSGNATLILGESSFGRGLRSVSAIDLAKKP